MLIELEQCKDLQGLRKTRAQTLPTLVEKALPLSLPLAPTNSTPSERSFRRAVRVRARFADREEQRRFPVYDNGTAQCRSHCRLYAARFRRFGKTAFVRVILLRRLTRRFVIYTSRLWFSSSRGAFARVLAIRFAQEHRERCGPPHQNFSSSVSAFGVFVSSSSEGSSGRPTTSKISLKSTNSKRCT